MREIFYPLTRQFSVNCSSVPWARRRGSQSRPRSHSPPSYPRQHWTKEWINEIPLLPFRITICCQLQLLTTKGYVTKTESKSVTEISWIHFHKRVEQKKRTNRWMPVDNRSEEKASPALFLGDIFILSRLRASTGASLADEEDGDWDWVGVPGERSSWDHERSQSSQSHQTVYNE